MRRDSPVGRPGFALSHIKATKEAAKVIIRLDSCQVVRCSDGTVSLGSMALAYSTSDTSEFNRASWVPVFAHTNHP